MAAVADGLEALEQIEALQPDVAVLDVRMPGLDGIQVVRRLGEQSVAVPVLLLSAYGEGELVHEALQAGAAGFLSKDAEEVVLCDAVLALAAGRTVVDPALQGEVVEHVRSVRRGVGAPLPMPSERELEVLRGLAQGWGSAEIAGSMHLSTGTVKTYQTRVYEKLGVSGATAAVAEALRRGLIE